MSSTSRHRRVVEYRSKAEVVGSWNTLPAKSPTSPCIFMLPDPNRTKSRKPEPCAKIYSPVFEIITNVSRLIHLPNAWNLTLMATVLTLSAASTRTIETAATTSQAITATPKRMHTNRPIPQHQLQVLPPLLPCPQPIRQPRTTTLSTMPISQAATLMLLMEDMLAMLLTISSTTSKHNNKQRRHRPEMLATRPVHRRLLQVCELAKATKGMNGRVCCAVEADAVIARIKVLL